MSWAALTEVLTSEVQRPCKLFHQAPPSLCQAKLHVLCLQGQAAPHVPTAVPPHTAASQVYLAFGPPQCSVLLSSCPKIAQSLLFSIACSAPWCGQNSQIANWALPQAAQCSLKKLQACLCCKETQKHQTTPGQHAGSFSRDTHASAKHNRQSKQPNKGPCAVRPLVRKSWLLGSGAHWPRLQTAKPWKYSILVSASGYPTRLPPFGDVRLDAQQVVCMRFANQRTWSWIWVSAFSIRHEHPRPVCCHRSAWTACVHGK